MYGHGDACFYNKIDGKLESYPECLEDSDIEEEWAEVTGKIKSYPDRYLQIEKTRKREAFEVIQNFIDEINHTPTRNKFIGAISAKKPFDRF